MDETCSGKGQENEPNPLAPTGESWMFERPPVEASRSTFVAMSVVVFVKRSVPAARLRPGNAEPLLESGDPLRPHPLAVVSQLAVEVGPELEIRSPPDDAGLLAQTLEARSELQGCIPVVRGHGSSDRGQLGVRRKRLRCFALRRRHGISSLIRCHDIGS